MPRYFFHVRDRRDILDDEGVVLRGRAEVHQQAIVSAGEMLKESGKEFWTGSEWIMQVVDEAGATVCVLKFSAEEPASAGLAPADSAD
jgi:hypothetical protein